MKFKIEFKDPSAKLGELAIKLAMKKIERAGKNIAEQIRLETPGVEFDKDEPSVRRDENSVVVAINNPQVAREVRRKKALKRVWPTVPLFLK